MRKLLSSVVLCGAFALTACGGGGDSAAVKEYKGLVKEGCACKDIDCAKAVDKKEQDWRMANYKGLSKDDKGAMKNARQEFTKCRDALVNAGG